MVIPSLVFVFKDLNLSLTIYDGEEGIEENGILIIDNNTENEDEIIYTNNTKAPVTLSSLSPEEESIDPTTTTTNNNEDDNDDNDITSVVNGVSFFLLSFQSLINFNTLRCIHHTK